MKFIPVITACLLSLFIMGSINDPKTDNDKYCAKIKDGKITIVHGENPITGTVTLSNGTQIMTDGTIVMRDGTKLALKEGECVDKDGKIDKDNPTKEKNNEGKK